MLENQKQTFEFQVYESSDNIFTALSINTLSNISELFSCIYLILEGGGFTLVR